MNHQEAFNRAYLGLKEQGKPAAVDGVCVFYSECLPGVTCAVGQLLTPYYRKKFQDRGIWSVGGVSEGDSCYHLLTKGLEVSGFPLEEPGDLAFLDEIQDAHDRYAEIGICRVLLELERVATARGLTVPE